MNYRDWYTDRMDVHRVQPYQDGYLTRHRRVKVLENVPCRIYSSSKHGPRMQPTAAYTESADDKLACANDLDVRPGDELIIRRGGGLRKTQQTIRAFAGEPVHYYEPFGAVIPGLAHQEMGLLQKEYLDGEVESDGTGGRPPEEDGGACETPAPDPEAFRGNR